jgi:hypothetical protein
MDDKQKTFNYLKHGFTQDDVLVRITPLQKKSIAHSIMVYGINDKDKTVDINEMYRWGVGYREGMELDYPELLTGDYFSCDPYLGHGSDLDDLCSVDFSYNGEWSDEEKQDFEDKWYNGDPDDDDGRSGMGWLMDWQDQWEVEQEEITINGPVRLDIVDRAEYNKVFIEDYKPNKEADNG